MGFYDEKVCKTISGCNPEYWRKFMVICKGEGSDASKTINLFIANYVYEWQINQSFQGKPFDIQIQDMTRYMHAPYWRKADFFKNNLDKAA